MQIIKPTVELEFITPDAYRVIERAGRTCYKSEDKITEESAEKFCKMIQTRNHMSVLEHASATFRIICDRGVSHEIVRHRIASFSQESTRYCNYSSKKKGLTFIQPAWISDEDLAATLAYNNSFKPISERDTSIDDSVEEEYVYEVGEWIEFLETVEETYNKYITKFKWTPEQARALLPNCVKTELVMTANFREWLHFLELRTSTAAHPDMRIIANMIKDKLVEKYPAIFDVDFD